MSANQPALCSLPNVVVVVNTKITVGMLQATLMKSFES